MLRQCYRDNMFPISGCDDQCVVYVHWPTDLFGMLGWHLTAQCKVPIDAAWLFTGEAVVIWKAVACWCFGRVNGLPSDRAGTPRVGCRFRINDVSGHEVYDEDSRKLG